MLFIPIFFLFSQTTNETSYSFQIQKYKKIIAQPDVSPQSLQEALNYLLMFGESSLILKEVTKKILQSRDYPKELKIKALEIAHAFYENDFLEEVEKIYLSNSDNYIQSLAYFYLLKNNFVPHLRNSEFEFIFNYYQNFQTQLDPPLKDILAWRVKNQWILYSIHPRNREYAGILLIKTPNGKFLRNANGNIFYIPQFARSITNLPYFFFNGNTPSGVYKLGSRTISKNPSIGKTPIISIFLPFEISKQAFLGEKGDWQEEDINNLFPNSWHESTEIYESFYAGKLGRSLIAMHGSKLKSRNFLGYNFFPFQPAFGCITTLEIWNEKDQLQHSFQVELLQILPKSMNGLVYVVNRNINRRIVLEDVLLDILEVEASLP